jgi:hypothetical protein
VRNRAANHAGAGNEYAHAEMISAFTGVNLRLLTFSELGATILDYA